MYPSPPPYSEAGNGVAVVTPASNANAEAATSAAVTVSAAAKDRPKTKNIAGPPVYYPPGVELFAKKEELMAMEVSTSTKDIKTHLGLIFKVHMFTYLHFTAEYSETLLKSDYIRDRNTQNKLLFGRFQCIRKDY
jgi:hypothetical protein